MARSRENKIELTAYDDLFETDESRAEANLSKIREIPIAEIDEFPDHPFKVLMDEDMEQLVDSVRRERRNDPCHSSGRKRTGGMSLSAVTGGKRLASLQGLKRLNAKSRS